MRPDINPYTPPVVPFVSYLSNLRLVHVPRELHSPTKVSENTRLQHATNVALIQVKVVEGNTFRGKQQPLGQRIGSKGTS